jgi:trimethylamine--corrinoid protein Co-methyltransferase
MSHAKLNAEKIHDAALSILERTGLRFDNAEAVEILRKAGVRISNGNIAHPDRKIVEWAIKCAPKSVKVYNRQEELAMDLGGDRNHYGAGSDCAHLYDPRTGYRRQALMSDVIDGMRILDALPHIDFAMSMVMPSDTPLGHHEVYQMEAMLSGTGKPVVFVGESEASTISAAEMMAVIRGSFEALAEKPLGVNYINSVSPFIHNDHSLRRLIYGARKGLPTVYQPGQGRGTVGPMTAAGNVALGHAAQMGLLVLQQLVKEGAPMIRGLPGEGMMDLKTMVSLYMPPDMGRLTWETAKLAGLPLFGTAGCSDAKVFDCQAAAEAGMSLVLQSLGGANLIHDLGYLDSAMTYSFDMLVLSNEIIGWLKQFMAPAVINDETLALDVIDQLGHQGGNFLGHKHTFKHMRETWEPWLFDHLSYQNWKAKGSLTFQQKANTEVLKILESHCPEPLHSSKLSRLREIRDKYNF